MSKSKKTQGQAVIRQTKAESSFWKNPPKVRIVVLSLFLCSFLIHAILNLTLKQYPVYIIDEGLYTNIARSLAWEGKLAFRAQPIDYPYIFYPILLVPVYWLTRLLNADVYRFVQLFNTLLITSSVFPVFLFAKDFTGSNKKAFFAALIVSVMPDMLMGAYSMTECLIWPLSLWMVCFCWRFFTISNLRYGLLTALFTGFLFFTKPGAIAGGASMMVLHLFLSFKKGGKPLLASLLSCLLLLAEVGMVFALYRLLLPDESSFLGLYEKQTADWGGHDALIALEGTFLITFMFCFACGGIWMLIPLIHLKLYDSSKRQFILALSLGVFATIIGTAIFVVTYKWDTLGPLPTHLRYCSMYIPFFFIFALDLDIPTVKLNRKLSFFLLLFMLLSVFPGVRLGFVKDRSFIIDSMTLAAFGQNRQFNGFVPGWLLTISVIAFLAFWMLNLKEQGGWQPKLQQLSTFAFIGFLLFNAVCAHISAKVSLDPTIAPDAREVNSLIGNHESLGITQRHYVDIDSYLLDSRLNAPMQQITSDQTFVQMRETNGIYTPFVPMTQVPNINDHETPDTDTLVLGMTIAEHLELSDNTDCVTTTNGHFTVVRIKDQTKPWLDSMMYGLDDNTLLNGTTGYIHIFNNSKNQNGFVDIKLKASGSGMLNFEGAESLQLTASPTEYTITVPFRDLIGFTAEGSNVDIFSYITAPANK